MKFGTRLVVQNVFTIGLSMALCMEKLNGTCLVDVI
jgi:hypothetical protein